MTRSYQRSLPELIDGYRTHLFSNVSTVQIFGEEYTRELKAVFVELTLVEERNSVQNAELLGMMDSAMQRRVNPFLTGRGDAFEISAQDEIDNKRRVRPEELLRPGTRAIIAGAPGCGKTTLLKYLALQAEEKHGRLVVLA